MPNTAISAQGTVLKISGAAGVARNISGVNLTNPAVLTMAALAVPAANGALSATAGGTLAAATYYVRSTWTNAAGETLAAPETSLAVALNNVLNVAAPANPPAGATGWNVYVSTATGTETKQNGSTPIALGTAWVEPTTGLVAGTALPASNTANHGLNKGDVVSIASVAGTTQLNGLTAVVEYVTATTVALAGVDASQMGAYTSGGTLTPVTWQQINNLINFKGFDGQANELDSTNMSSTAKEFMLGLQDFGHFTFDVFRDYSDLGQQAFDGAKQAGVSKNFQLVLPNGKIASFTGFVKNSPLEGAVDGLLKTAGVSIRITGAVTVQ